MKTVLITGASRGIGKATTKYFLAKEWQVIATSTSGSLDYSDNNLTNYQFDLGDTESIDNLVKSLKDSHTKLDCLINSAAITVDREEELVNLDTLSNILRCNLIGTINLTQQLIPLMNMGGVVINISSEYGSLTEDWGNVVPSYRIAKAAINMFTRNFYKSKPIIEKKIKVYSFDPGWVKTDMGGPDAPRQPEEPAVELFDLTNSNLPSGEFYQGLTKRDW